jgi:hypothetical protein
VSTALEDVLSKQRGETGFIHIQGIGGEMRGNGLLWRREFAEVHIGVCEVRDFEMTATIEAGSSQNKEN